MGVLVGRQAPDFTAAAVLGNGEIVDSYNLHETIKGKKFYFHEVIGFKAINNNNIIGIVEKINDQSPQAIFEIRNPDKLILVPIHNKFIIRINRKEKKN